MIGPKIDYTDVLFFEYTAQRAATGDLLPQTGDYQLYVFALLTPA
jgi:hypothetical protein